MTNWLHPLKSRPLRAKLLLGTLAALASPLGAAPPVVPAVRNFSLPTAGEPPAPLFLDLLAYASDVDGDPLVCQVLQGHGQLVPGPAFCTWIYNGTVPTQISYRVVDEHGQASVPGWIDIREGPFVVPRDGPSGLSLVQTGAAQVSFQWLDLPNWESRYEIHGGTTAADADDLGSTTLVELLNANSTGHLEDLPSAPPLGQTRYYKVWACDDEGCEGSSLAQVTFLSMNSNRPPVAGNDSASVARSGTLAVGTVQLLANDSDPDGDEISIVATSQPSLGILTPIPGGYLYWNTQPGASDSFTYTLSDGQATSAPATVTIAIVNEVVDAVDRTFTTPEGVPLYIPYSALTQGQTTAKVHLLAFTTPSHGALDFCCSPGTDRPDGFWYVPRNTRVDSATFYYSLFNNSSYDSALITVHITETGNPNAADATEARPDELKHLRLLDPATPENPNPTTATTVYHFADFRRGRSQPDLGDQLRFATSITEAGSGSVSFVLPDPATSGAFSAKNYEGAVILQSGTGLGSNVLNYQIKGNDNLVSSGAATIDFVAPPASGIFARSDLLTAIEGKVTPINWGSFTANDYWNLAPPAPPTATPEHNLLGAPRYGVFTHVFGLGSYTYRAPANFTGVDWFSYAIGWNGTYSQARVAIKIIPSRPIPDPETITVTAGSSATVDVIAGDTDPHDTVLRAVAVSDPANGTATLFPDGKRVTYAPDLGFVGADTFTYTVQDPDGNQATGTVSVIVLNRPPVATGDLAVVTEDGGLTIDIPVLLNDYDPDGDALTVTAVEKPQSGNVTILPSGAIRYQLILQTAGDVDKFSYTIGDGRGGTATAVVQISIHCPLCQ
ncbi:MAG: Ig-like domain-containing protein [Thermoanaerobaculia bacterium]|nr:Ig-like domain-containing protein [Thermoanaerobaculia bacterium]